MAESTEAACLLQSGAMYPHRIGLRTESGDVIFAGVKPGGVSIYFGDAPIYHFDLDGRWQRAFVDGVHFLKGLDATVHSINREREGVSMVLYRQTLPFGRAVDLDASIRSMALDLIDHLCSGELEILPIPEKARPFSSEDFRSFLERAAAWDSASWFAHRERYLGTYGPMPFLPPDCPTALVLQATLGNRDTHAFGRTRGFEHYVRSPDEFAEHCQAVKRLSGRRISQYNRIFLAGTDVLHQPETILREYFGHIRTHFPRESTNVSPSASWDSRNSPNLPIQVMLDDLSDPLPSRNGWREIAQSGLTRVTIGVESGDPAIRSGYGKNWANESLVSTINQIHEAEITVGLILLLGAGGQMMTESHQLATLKLLESLPLGPEDLVTLIDSRSLDATSDEGSVPLTDDEIEAEVKFLKSWKSFNSASKRPKMVVYNPDKQPT